MDQQNLFLFGFFTVTLALSAFILWGPSPRPKKRKAGFLWSYLSEGINLENFILRCYGAYLSMLPQHRLEKRNHGHIAGLENLGSTCFLNTLMQALASCALFIQWLMQQKHEKNSLTSSLTDILWVLNGEGKADTYTPVGVLSALKRHGWMVPSGEQDAHELFHVIVSTLQDENRNVFKAGSLSDALPDPDVLPLSCNINDDNFDEESAKTVQSNSGHSEPNIPAPFASKIEKEEAKLARGDGGNANSEEPSCGDSSLVGNEIRTMFSEQTLQLLSQRLSSPEGETEKGMKNNCGDVEETKNVQSELANNEGDITFKNERLLNIFTKDFKTKPESSPDKSLDYHGCYDRTTGKSMSLPHVDSPPFQGLLTSTLQCSVCGYYSSLHYDTFDSLSLPLGDNFHLQVLKLQDLLKRFVKTEIIPEVECSKCCKKTTALKTMNFGKLPACLCLHIARTTWQNYSHAPTKRDDFVEFPEYLPMDEYTVSARMKKRDSVSSLHSLNSESLVSEKKTYKHMYRLKSVVVHLGDVSSGHFLTYRRGPLNSLKRHRMEKLAGAYTDSRRWFMTSDDNVKVSTLAEAMESLAYMLFYEKCSPDMFPVDDE